MAFEAGAVAKNVAAVRARMEGAATRAGRRVDEVTLVGISKTFPAEAIRAAWDAGVRHFGENRVQEWEGKRGEIAELRATWHLVGHLQSNKARRAAQVFTAVDSVDGIDLARRLDAARGEQPGGRLRVLLEVRLAPEETKSGAEPANLNVLARAVLELPHLDLQGLMCIPPFAADAEQARPYFRRLRELRDALLGTLGGAASLPVLSMGMSHDFEIAIEEGATEVRLGSALFGARG
jgi:PLP dependent protein